MLGVLLAAMAVLALALPASANVVPSDPKVGTTALTRMSCYTGSVSFTITGNGVSIPVGSAVAGSDGWAQLNFNVPAVPAGTYNMQGRGTGCDGQPHVVNVTFAIRTSGGDTPQYPPASCSVGVNRSEALVGERAIVVASCFQGVVRFTIDDVLLGTATARTDGTAELSFTVPNLPKGQYLLAAAGTTSSGAPSVLSTALAVREATAVVSPPAAKVDVPTQVLGAVQTATPVAAAIEPVATANATVASTGTTNRALVRTGSDAGTLVRLALVVMAVGGVLVVGTRRRNAGA